MRFILIIMLSILPLDSSAIEIQNFKSGLMCGINKDEMGWVCFEQEEINVTGQSTCLSGEDVLKCTWYGYSFDYVDAKPGQKVSCKYWDSEPVTNVNLEGAEEESKKYFEFSFILDKSQGHFTNPQYSVLGVSGTNKAKKITQEVVCSSEGVELYSYKFETIYPAGQ